MTYKLTNFADVVINLRTNAPFPYRPGTNEQENYEAQLYQRWLDAGNTPQAADPPPLVFSGGYPISNKIRTTNATPTTVFQAALIALTGYTGILELIAVDAGNGNVRCMRASIAAKRLNGDALLVGNPVIIADHVDAGLAATAVAAGVTGTNFWIRVTGLAGRNIDWFLTGTFVSFTPQGR